MDTITLARGIRYETLIMRAYQLEQSSVELGADRKHYYLLYFIQQGYDLRKTGYVKQFISIKEHVYCALKQFLSMELHKHESIFLRRLLAQLEDVHGVDTLDKVIEGSLNATSRFADLPLVYA